MADEPGTVNDDAREVEQVRAWRVVGAMGLGYEYVDAVRIADDGTDLHQLADLIDSGCPHALAAQIISPI